MEYKYQPLDMEQFKGIKPAPELSVEWAHTSVMTALQFKKRKPSQFCFLTTLSIQILNQKAVSNVSCTQFHFSKSVSQSQPKKMTCVHKVVIEKWVTLVSPRHSRCAYLTKYWVNWGFLRNLCFFGGKSFSFLLSFLSCNNDSTPGREPLAVTW